MLPRLAGHTQRHRRQRLQSEAESKPNHASSLREQELQRPHPPSPPAWPAPPLSPGGNEAFSRTPIWEEGAAAHLLTLVLGMGLAHLPRVAAQQGIEVGPVQRPRKALQGGHAHPHLHSTAGTCEMPHVWKQHWQCTPWTCWSCAPRTQHKRSRRTLRAPLRPRRESQVGLLDVHQCRARVHQQGHLRQLVVAFFVRLLATRKQSSVLLLKLCNRQPEKWRWQRPQNAMHLCALPHNGALLSLKLENRNVYT